MDVTSATRRQVPVTGTPEQLIQGILGKLVGTIEGKVEGKRVTSHEAFEAVEKLTELGQTEALKICLLNPEVADCFRQDIIRKLVKLKDSTAVEPILQYLLEVRLNDDGRDKYERLHTVSWALNELDIPQGLKNKSAQTLEGFYWQSNSDCYDTNGVVRQRIEKLKGEGIIHPTSRKIQGLQSQLTNSGIARVQLGNANK